MAGQVAVADDLLAGVQVESADENRQAAEQDPLRVGQQRVRPVHRGLQRLLAAHRGARSAGEQPESILQAGQDLGR